jgi:hypothetical protein
MVCPKSYGPCSQIIVSDSQPALPITNETFRYISNPRVHPNSNKIIASKWFISTITLGAPEGWEYPLPSKDNPNPSGGKRVLGRSPPPGADYGEVQVGPEQFIWWGEDRVIYSKNARVQDKYSNVNAGMSAIMQWEFVNLKQR